MPFVSLQSYFPINYLRNVGVKYLATEYVFLVDIDLIPNKGLYDQLPAILQSFKSQEKAVSTRVPDFDTKCI